MGGYVIAALCGSIFTLALRLWAWGNKKRFRVVLGITLLFIVFIYIINTIIVETQLGIHYPSYFTANELSLWIGAIATLLFAIANDWRDGTKTFQSSWFVVASYWSVSMLLAPLGWVFIAQLSFPFFIWAIIWARVEYNQRLKKDAEEDSRPYQYH